MLDDAIVCLRSHTKTFTLLLVFAYAGRHLLTLPQQAARVFAAYFVRDPDYTFCMDIQQEIDLAIYRAFAEAGIEFAFPTQTIDVVPAGEAQPAGGTLAPGRRASLSSDHDG